jgi:hypothetical protein
MYPIHISTESYQPKNMYSYKIAVSATELDNCKSTMINVTISALSVLYYAGAYSQRVLI